MRYSETHVFPVDPKPEPTEYLDIRIGQWLKWNKDVNPKFAGSYRAPNDGRTPFNGKYTYRTLGKTCRETK